MSGRQTVLDEGNWGIQSVQSVEQCARLMHLSVRFSTFRRYIVSGVAKYQSLSPLRSIVTSMVSSSKGWQTVKRQLTLARHYASEQPAYWRWSCKISKF